MHRDHAVCTIRGNDYIYVVSGNMEKFVLNGSRYFTLTNLDSPDREMFLRMKKSYYRFWELQRKADLEVAMLKASENDCDDVYERDSEVLT